MKQPHIMMNPKPIFLQKQSAALLSVSPDQSTLNRQSSDLSKDVQILDVLSDVLHFL